KISHYSLLAPFTCHPAGRNEKEKGSNKLLLVSFDGFRWNYDQDVNTPNMDLLVKQGVKAEYITPPFVTMTSPSHFTTITGRSRCASVICILFPFVICSSEVVKYKQLEGIVRFHLKKLNKALMFNCVRKMHLPAPLLPTAR
uniref:Uncharacterized protein n=1 Tax=Chelydra serpentina TaxID=8475 RepID=A0A8C3RY64_CHESE